MVIYKTNFFRQVWENPRTNSFFLHIALTCLGINCVVLLYASVIFPCKHKREMDFEKDSPKLISAMALSSVTMTISATAAMWPVWGFLTPIYMLILIFGGSFSMLFLPGGSCGTLMFWALAIVAAIVSHNLPHEAVW